MLGTNRLVWREPCHCPIDETNDVLAVLVYFGDHLLLLTSSSLVSSFTNEFDLYVSFPFHSSPVAYRF